MFILENRYIKTVLFLVISILSAITAWLALNQTPYANGWDGYYYIMQVVTFIENGTMRAPDASPIYPYYILLTYVLKDPVIAYKVGTSLLVGLFSFLVSLVSYKYNNKQLHLGVLAGSISVFSPTLVFFASQFPKNLLAVNFLLLLFYFLQGKSSLLKVLFFILCIITHRLTAGLSVILIATSYVKIKQWRLLISLMFILAGAIILLPGVFHFYDLERFAGAFSEKPIVPPLELIRYFGIENIPLYWKTELVILYFAFIYFFISTVIWYYKNQEINKSVFSLLVILVILSLPVLTYEKANIGFRFILVFYIIVVLIIPFILKRTHRWIPYSLAIIFIVFSFRSFKAYSPGKHDPSYAHYFNIKMQLEENLEPENVELIVAHQGLSQIIITYSEFEATNWKPSDKERYQKIWRVTANISKFYFKKMLEEPDWEYIIQLDYDHFLIREDIWHKFYAKANNSNFEQLKIKVNDWYNPSKTKPKYLLKGRSKEYVH